MKSRFFICLGAALAAGPDAQAAEACQSSTAALLAAGRAESPSYTLDHLRDDLSHVEHAWKRELLFKLLAPEARQGRRVATLRAGHVSLPYFLALPRDLAEGIATVARAKGLRPGERYVVLPAKILAAIGVNRAYGNLIIVASLAGNGQLLDSMGLIYGDPVVDETDPDDLAEDEHVLIVSLASAGDIRPTNFASPLSAAALGIIKRTNPKALVFDLSNASGIAPLPGEDSSSLLKRRFEAALRGNEGKKIKKVIFSGHGNPGNFGVEAGTYSPSMSFTRMAEILAPLKAQLAPRSEIHIGACLAAASEEGREQMQSMAHLLLDGRGGSIEGSNFTVSAGLLGQGTLWLQPVVGLSSQVLDIVAGRAMALSSSFRDDFNLPDDAWRAAPSYRYEVD